MLTPTAHPLEYDSVFNNLGSVLHTRFGHTGEPHDLNESIMWFRKASESKSGLRSETLVTIKKKATNISYEVLDHVLGYTVGHDISHPGWQDDRGGEPQPQFSMDKGTDGWAPWGPAIVTKDTIPDPQTLNIWTKVNRETMQNNTTANMIFDVKSIVSFFYHATPWRRNLILSLRS